MFCLKKTFLWISPMGVTGQSLWSATPLSVPCRANPRPLPTLPPHSTQLSNEGNWLSGGWGDVAWRGDFVAWWGGGGYMTRYAEHLWCVCVCVCFPSFSAVYHSARESYRFCVIESLFWVTYKVKTVLLWCCYSVIIRMWFRRKAGKMKNVF